MANRAVVLVPVHDANVIQPGQILSGTVIQPVSGEVVQYVGQPVSSPHQNPRLVRLGNMFKAEAKTLGAIQIMIGLIHIGFGTVFATITGYPFMGGLFFIISGALSVSAENHRNKCLVQSSVGMNITSAVMSVFSVVAYILYLTGDISGYLGNEHAGPGLAILLLLFSLLEFCITVLAAHFGCRVACCTDDQAIGYVPITVTGNDTSITVNNDVARAEGYPSTPPLCEADFPK